MYIMYRYTYTHTQTCRDLRVQPNCYATSINLPSSSEGIRVLFFSSSRTLALWHSGIQGRERAKLWFQRIFEHGS